jgi:uncharacterized protein (TIGR01244 family)
MKKSMLLSRLLLFIVIPAFGADDAILGELPNMRQPEQNRIVAGAIDAANLGRLRAAGIKHVISLRTAEEVQGFDEAGIAAGLGIDYHSIPIKGVQSLTKENAEKLDALLKQIGEEPTLVHCASGNRVGGLIAVREALINGQSTEAAIAEGRRWGLTSLEDAVRTALEEASKSKTK